MGSVLFSKSNVVIQAQKLPRSQRQPHRTGQGRENGTGPICAKHPEGRFGKWGLSPFRTTDQLGQLARAPVNLDEVGPFDLAEKGPAAALVDAQDRLQRGQGGAVDLDVIGQELADRRAGASGIDGGGVTGLEQEGVGLSAPLA
jgi:hypothetical protein